MYFIFLNATEYGTLLCTNVACSLLFVSIGAPRCNLKTVFALPHFEEKKKKKSFITFLLPYSVSMQQYIFLIFPKN